MKHFGYVVIDSSGARKTGTIEALSERQARDNLAKEGYLVEVVNESREASFTKSLADPLIGGVSLENQLTFFRQLHAMIRAAVPLVQALDTLAESARSTKLRKVIEDIKSNVLTGRSMSESMEKYPEVFTPLYISMVRAGEEGGVLERSLAHLCDYMNREIKLRNEIKAKTFYPKLLVVIAILIIIVANTLIGYFSSSAGGPAMLLKSPLLNPRVLAWLLPVSIGLWLFFRYAPQSPGVRKSLHQMYLNIPYFGTTIHMLAMAKFGRAFSALVSAGVPINRAVVLSSEASGNDYLSDKISSSAKKIQEGRSIAQSFRETGAFTPVALDMAATGETSGNLDAMFAHMAEQYEDEADVRLDKSCKTLGVLVLLAAVAIVAYTIVTFWLSYAARYQSPL